MFPEPKIVIAALEACRRLNEHSVAVRYLEALKWKAGSDADKIYPWLIQEIRPTLDKLKTRLNWTPFVNPADYSLIGLPTNYYGVAFSIARLRHLMGWEGPEASEPLLPKMINH